MSSSPFTAQNLAPLISIKLDHTNYLLWVSELTPVLRSLDLFGIVDGSELCPPKFILESEGKEPTTINAGFTLWQPKDQYLLSWLNATLSETVLSSVYGLTTSRQVWTLLASRFASQSKSRVAYLKRQLQTLRQGTQPCSQFLQTAKSLADQLAIVGKPVDDDDLISYLISGLNPSFHAFITSYSFATRQTSLSFDEFQTELLNYEMMVNSHNSAPDSAHLAAMAATSQDIAPDHQTWLADSGANNHITADLSNLRISEPYHGENEVVVEAFCCFLKFKCYAENLLNQKIKCLQSDGGGEFTYHPFCDFLQSNGIIHHMSCPHTPQQNGVAERKHRHVTETGLAMLAHAHLLLTYWVEAFNTAIFLINKLPTAVLHNQSPFQFLLNKSPDYSCIKVFGCICYPLLRPYNHHKLLFRSKKCIFLGYSSNHKGYRCLDPSTSRVYLSRHVIFDEAQFSAPTPVSSLSQPS
ncbi:hypothetical protein F0562_027825 [Nyssa sinensis]|uniref:Integrase catalytic domain-containing protein n=1 Tax=Nyssa sinensis TaxID=561372 RepID=A0A5J5B8V7_9ASTE|nr:hypothetical protein F0562_027825 [Nyssa sinensis]